MSAHRITNCHVHTFTERHVPVHYPSRWLFLFKKIPLLLKFVAFLIRAQFPGAAETLDRLYRFNQEASVASQRKILDRVRQHYPATTRFVVLPMDMAPIGHGPVPHGIARQHDDLAAMARDPDLKDVVIPFATLHPGSGQAGVDEVRRRIEEQGFRGLKIYPRLGFRPDHDLLMRQVYPLLVERNLPVMTHCSRGGVRGRGVTPREGNACTDPAAYLPVMQEFPALRICLAHFGGAKDWRDYVEEGLPPGDAEARKRNWQVAIRDMIACGEYPGLWTDISYTLFHFDDNVPFLKLFLAGADADSRALRRRVLFGSDFYMTRQEKLSERAVCFRLRNELGDPLFWRIAERNPAIWLGEAAETDDADAPAK